ncbi:MAG: nitrate- and nitrite sensing domain-containing protein [Opitutaceae bacterium]|nr:nitrate- and nitrite sensing domain-containing protein [Opitutaceae bacterium]
MILRVSAQISRTSSGLGRGGAGPGQPARRDQRPRAVASGLAGYYTRTIAALLDVVVAMSHLSKDADIGNGISCYVNYLQAKEQAGIERATLTGVFAADAFTPESYSRFSRARGADDLPAGL